MDSDFRLQLDKSLINSIDLLDGLLRVSQIVRLRLNDWLGHFELNDGRHAVLVALDNEGDSGCSQARLAERLGQSESNVSTLIERMQRDGLVSRSKSEADRRKRILRITAAGRNILIAVDAKRGAFTNQLFSGIKLNDQLKLLDLLKRLADGWESSFQPSTGAATPFVTKPEPEWNDPANDPASPQFALRQMLQSLSTSSLAELRKKEVA
jgi:DNA-binding MarR family transcriptional regulator